MVAAAAVASQALAVVKAEAGGGCDAGGDAASSPATGVQPTISKLRGIPAQLRGLAATLEEEDRLKTEEAEQHDQAQQALAEEFASLVVAQDAEDSSFDSGVDPGSPGVDLV